MTDFLVRARGLTRRYPIPRQSLFERLTHTTALEDADLDVRAGSANRLGDALQHALRAAQEQERGTAGGAEHLRRLTLQARGNVDRSASRGLQANELVAEPLASR